MAAETEVTVAVIEARKSATDALSEKSELKQSK